MKKKKVEPNQQFKTDTPSNNPRNDEIYFPFQPSGGNPKDDNSITKPNPQSNNPIDYPSNPPYPIINQIISTNSQGSQFFDPSHRIYQNMSDPNPNNFLPNLPSVNPNKSEHISNNKPPLFQTGPNNGEYIQCQYQGPNPYQKFPSPQFPNNNNIPNVQPNQRVFNPNYQYNMMNLNQNPNFYMAFNTYDDPAKNDPRNQNQPDFKSSGRSYSLNYLPQPPLENDPNRYPAIPENNPLNPAFISSLNNSIPSIQGSIQKESQENIYKKGKTFEGNTIQDSHNQPIIDMPSEKLNEINFERENLSKLIPENLIVLEDLEKHPHQFNFFAKAFPFITVQISYEVIHPKNKKLPYTKGISLINQLRYSDQGPYTEDNETYESKQLIFYDCGDKEKYVLKRSSYPFSLLSQQKDDVSFLMSKCISEKYLEYCLCKLYSASPHSISVFFFNIIVLKDISYTVTEMLMDSGGAGISNNLILSISKQPEKLYDFFVQMCDSILFLEQHKIEHNDIKIDNVLVDYVNGIPLFKLIDFDIGNNQSVTCKTGSGMRVKGYSPIYAAPEIIQHIKKNNDQSSIQINPWKAQIYSLGITILKLGDFFVPRYIFPKPIDDLKQSEEEYSIVLKKLNEYYKSKDDTLTKNIITIVEKCIDFEPNNRPTSFELSCLLKGLQSKNSDSINNEFKTMQKLRISSTIQANSIRTSKQELIFDNMILDIFPKNKSFLNLNEKNMIQDEVSLNTNQKKEENEFRNKEIFHPENSKINSKNIEINQDKKANENNIISTNKDTLKLQEKKLFLISQDPNYKMKLKLQPPEKIDSKFEACAGSNDQAINDILNENKMLKMKISKLEQESIIMIEFPEKEKALNDKLENERTLSNNLKKEIETLKNNSFKLEKENSNLGLQVKQFEDKIKNIETENQELKNSLENPDVLRNILISKFGLKSNSKIDIENLQKFLENMTTGTPYRIFLINYSKFEIDSKLENFNLLMNDPGKANSILVRTEYNFSTALQQFTFLFNCFYKLGLHKKSKINTIEEFAETLDFYYTQKKMKEIYYSLGIEKLAKEIGGKLEENNAKNVANTKSFNGQLKFGRPQGIGYIIYENGTIFATDFVEGKIVNHCFIYKKNELFFGVFDPFSFNGLGCSLIIDPKVSLSQEMDLYFGFFTNLQPHGYGKMNLLKEGTYIGNWEEGKRFGQGKFINKEGKAWIGNWKFNKLDGVGKLVEKDKSYYEGEFENGCRTKGKYYYSNGKIYDGFWKEEKMNGKGKLTSPDNSYYDGNYVNNQRDGYGEACLEDGSIYMGQWKGDSPEGEGRFIRKSGEIYIGSFKCGVFDGRGKLTYEDNSYYEGEFKNHERNGIGKEVKNNNEVLEGLWKDDKFVGKNPN